MSKEMSEMFFNTGNRQAIEDVKTLRLAQIIAVDTKNMMATINILDGTSYRTTVPLPLPMVYPGGGIIAVPGRGAHVVVGIRAMQMPLILGYYPYNTMSPDSYFQMFKQMYGFPETFEEGEVFIRARGKSAKCITCGTVSTLDAWQARLQPTTNIELCPNTACNTPAVNLGPNGLPVDGPNGEPAYNKQFMGSTLRMTADAQLFYQADNIMSPEKGDTSNIFKFHIDGASGDVTLSDARNIRFLSSGDFYVRCQNYTVKADNSITETTQNKNFNSNDTVSDSVQSHILTATDTIAHVAQTLVATVAGYMSHTVGSRVLQIKNSDSYSAVGQTITVTGSSNGVVTSGPARLTQIGLSDGSTTSTISDDLELYGAEIRNVHGSSTVTIVGAATFAASSTYGLTVGTDYTQNVTGSWTGTSASANLTATGAFNLHGLNLIFNNGTLGVARVSDTVLVTATSDPVFINYFTLLKTFLDSFAAIYNLHTHASLGATPLPLMIPATSPDVPTQASGKITTGNTTVLA